MKTARVFNLPGKWPSYIPTVALDAQGWPMADFDVLVFTAQDPKYVSGTYKLSFNGQAVVKANGQLVACSKSIVNTLSLGVLSELVQCDVTVNGGQLVLSFSGTSGGVRAVSLYSSGNSGLFNKAFIDKLKPFSVIRAMDLLHTNDSTLVNWADRCLTSTPSCAGRDMPYEDLIELANQTGKDLWLNIPHQASDGYVAELAALLKSKLNKDRIVYVEYSNEVWNTQFKQSGQNQAAAEAEVATYKDGKGPLNLDGTDTNKFYWARRRVIQRLLTMSSMLKSALGMDRVRAVYASQVADTSHWKVGLDYIVKKYGAPKDFIYGIAGAPYFSTKERDNPLATRASLLAGLQSSVNNYKTQWNLPAWDGKAFASVTAGVQYAKYYGIKYLNYESGPDTQGASALEIKKEVNRSPEMGALVKQYLTNWYCSGGGLSNYFALSGTQTDHGSWGSLETIEGTSEKYKALLEISQKVVCP